MSITPVDMTVYPADETIALEEVDAKLVEACMDRVASAQTVLGAELERHLAAIDTAREELRAARTAYEEVVRVLVHRYLTRPGQFEFRPDIGAFVARRNQDHG